MGHLNLLKHPGEPTRVSERMLQEQRVAEQFHGAFEGLLDRRKQSGIPLESHQVSEATNENGLVDILTQLGKNEAAYIEHAHGYDVEKHILAIKRTQGTESIFTYISIVKADDEVHAARLSQEITDTGLGYSRQIDVSYDPDTFYITRVSAASQLNGLHHQDEDKKENDVDVALDMMQDIVTNAIPDSVDDVVVHSITQETDRIKDNLRGKGRIKALGATIKHIPELYRHERHAAA